MAFLPKQHTTTRNSRQRKINCVRWVMNQHKIVSSRQKRVILTNYWGCSAGWVQITYTRTCIYMLYLCKSNQYRASASTRHKAIKYLINRRIWTSIGLIALHHAVYKPPVATLSQPCMVEDVQCTCTCMYRVHVHVHVRLGLWAATTHTYIYIYIYIHIYIYTL